MANMPVSQQIPGSSAPHDPSSGTGANDTEQADKHGKKPKPNRERLASKPSSYTPAVLSTPPLLGQYNVPPSISPPSDAEEFANMPESHDQGSHAHAPSKGGRPNVLKKKPSKAQKTTAQHTSPGAPTTEHVQEHHDDGGHANVNITLENPDGKQSHTVGDAMSRPIPPSIRQGHPAADQHQASRPGTLHLPGETLHHDHVGPGSNKLDKATASPEQLLVEKERLASKLTKFGAQRLELTVPSTHSAQAKAKAEQAGS